MNWRHPNDTLWLCGDFSIELFDVSGRDLYEVYVQRHVPYTPIKGYQTSTKVTHELIGSAPTLDAAKAIARLNNTIGDRHG